MKDDKDDVVQLKKSETPSAFQKLREEWRIFGLALFRPIVFIPSIFTGVLLYTANLPNIGEGVSLILQAYPLFLWG